MAKYLHTDLHLSMKLGIRNISIERGGETESSELQWHLRGVYLGRRGFSITFRPSFSFLQEDFGESLSV